MYSASRGLWTVFQDQGDAVWWMRPIIGRAANGFSSLAINKARQHSHPLPDVPAVKGLLGE